MKSNDCLRRLRFILDYNDAAMLEVFAQADAEVSRTELSAWLKKDDDPDFAVCSDQQFATFLNGLINAQRGRKDGPLPEPETKLNNNLVFRKLKIAFDLKAEDILELLASVDMHISKHELSAFFRRADNKHYRACKDQVLRNFLSGLQLQLRGPGAGSSQ
ncbi:MAG: DUF1456 family protein [Pseudomonadales bacterium]